MDGQLDFSSNDYLGLRTHPEVLAALRASLGRGAWGAGASPVLSGYGRDHRDLESSLADFSCTEAALVFSSGFAGNAGVIACLADSQDLILSDQLNHASLIDGCRLSRATTLVYPHVDVGYVRDTLRQHRSQYQKVMLLTESIFSMDGDAAPLAELVELAQQYDCGLVVDEAHAVGVYGAAGGGLLEELNLQSHVLAKLGTLSKALGCVGGYVAGQTKVIEYLVNRCRSYMFSTAPPGPALAAARAALQLLQSMPVQRQQLRVQASALRQAMRQLGWNVPLGDSPIIPVIVGSEQRALRFSQQLRSLGIWVPAIRPPTVPEQTCRLRISLAVQHSAEDCQRLVAAACGLIGAEAKE
jgi:8-amino-7-oxononanoate synthase